MIHDLEALYTKQPPEKRAFIDGAYVSAKDGAVMQKVKSFSGFDLSGIAACSQADVDYAVACAKRAYEEGTWRNRPVDGKKAVILAIADLMEENKKELARIFLQSKVPLCGSL